MVVALFHLLYTWHYADCEENYEKDPDNNYICVACIGGGTSAEGDNTCRCPASAAPGYVAGGAYVTDSGCGECYASFIDYGVSTPDEDRILLHHDLRSTARHAVGTAAMAPSMQLSMLLSNVRSRVQFMEHLQQVKGCKHRSTAALLG